MFRPEQKTFKILCRADEGYCVTVRGGDDGDASVVMAAADPDDEYQHWYKDMRRSTRVKDEEGYPAFALVNKATGLAIKHSLGQSHPVDLVPYEYDPAVMDLSVLWTQSKDVGDGFRCIRMVTNIYLNFDAFEGDPELQDGTVVGLWEWNEGGNQCWKILPWDTDANAESESYKDDEYGGDDDAAPQDRRQGYDDGGLPPALSSESTVRIFCSAGEEYSVAARDGAVCLVPTDPSDDLQHWVKDMRRSTRIKDEDGYPAFALVNKLTGEAIKHSLGETHPVRLVRYDPDYLDESVLWTESQDVGDGFRCVRMVNNIHLNFDALDAGEGQGGVHDGTAIVLWEWCEGENQRWKILPWSE
uniref:PH domain-containing protein n=1 Tax=Hordeum vulgare subsp. vulgare TaxID=112509 RepID=A0A8I7BK82_HORVV